MEVDPHFVRIAGRKCLAKFEFAVSAAGKGYYILESGPNGGLSVTKSANRRSTALNGIELLPLQQNWIWKLIGEPSRKSSGHEFAFCRPAEAS
jgi:hypothetical protein